MIIKFLQDETSQSIDRKWLKKEIKTTVLYGYNRNWMEV